MDLSIGDQQVVEVLIAPALVVESDGKEIAAGSDPLDPSSTPKNPRGTAARGVTG